MKTKEALLLAAIREIRQMERGSLCAIRKGPSGAYYNHQSWEQGRNRVRYVPAAQVPALREAMAGYARVMALVRSYTEQVIQETRRRLDRKKGGSDGTSRRPPAGAETANGRSRAREARRRAAPRAGRRA
jgi:hypothetical protein